MRAPEMVGATAGNYAGALDVIAGLIAVSVVLPIIVRPPRRKQSV
jgi:hypothetical protein